MNNNTFKEGFFHIFKAAGYSLAGLKTGIRLSLAFRQESCIFAILILLLILTGKPFTTWIIALGGWLWVMMAELINTALEEALNLITMDYNIAIKNAKDMASAAVFLMLVLNASLWFAIFILGAF
jgi:diacylglycerol kinase (ATP)